jgi:hypothetical protein
VEFELQGIEADKLNSQHWQSIEQRMTTEEAACQLTGADNEENGLAFNYFNLERVSLS